jgi:hypothetical protein
VEILKYILSIHQELLLLLLLEMELDQIQLNI